MCTIDIKGVLRGKTVTIKIKVKKIEMNPNFHSKMSIVNHERGVIPSSVKFSVHKHENFPPQLRRRKR